LEEELETEYNSIEERDKTTDYLLNEDGDVISKTEDLKNGGEIKLGTGSKGQVKMKNIDIEGSSLEELEEKAHKLAFVHEKLQRAKSELEDVDHIKIEKSEDGEDMICLENETETDENESSDGSE